MCPKFGHSVQSLDIYIAEIVNGLLDLKLYKLSTGDSIFIFESQKQVQSLCYSRIPNLGHATIYHWYLYEIC